MRPISKADKWQKMTNLKLEKLFKWGNCTLVMNYSLWHTGFS